MLRFTLLAAGAALALAACGEASDPAASETAAAPTESQAAASSQAEQNAADLPDMAIGAEDAPVTIVEYASVTCPHCATFHETVYPQIKQKYVDTGRVRFVFREFPTPPATLAVAGFMVARCAAEKTDKSAYFAVLDNLFRTQMTWAFGDDPRGELLKIAAQAGMDEQAFTQCLERKDILAGINEKVENGAEEYEISGTPSFIIDGEKMRLATFEDFEQAIDARLEETSEPEGE